MTTQRRRAGIFGILAILMFGSYLLYTELLVRQVREEAALHTRMYALVQRGLLSLEEGIELETLLNLQETVTLLGVPIVAVSPEGEPQAWANLPFEAEATDSADRRRILEFAAELDRRNDPIVEPGGGTIHFGSPPVAKWLRWMPWLQAGGALLLLAIAAGLLRSGARAERQRMWAATARELAHQMGTPLSSLAGWTEVLGLSADARDELADPERIAEEIGADVERLERVSRRFELIGQPPALERVDVAETLAELENYLRPRLPSLGSPIKLDVRARPELPAIRGNRVLLVWALENVVRNALDALAGRGGSIEITAGGSADERVRIDIMDSGRGIPAAVRKRLFRAGYSTKRGGWGVGLSLTHRIIVDVHGGEIRARERLGGGTTFEIRLPAARA